MKLNELLLTERVVNAFDATTKKKYGKQVWDLLQVSYKPHGGFLSASSLEELINDSGLWKIVTRGGLVSSVNIYKDSHGRKSIASATDGTREGLHDYIMVKNADLKLQRSWAEVSGKPEIILIKSGAKPISAKYAGLLTGKEILGYNSDGVHYTRMIAGEPHEKTIFGFVEIDDKLRDKLKAANVNINDLPDNFGTKK